MKISLQPPAALYMGSYGGYLNFWLIILSNLLIPKICKWSQKIWNEVTNRVMCVGISLDLPLKNGGISAMQKLYPIASEQGILSCFAPNSAKIVGVSRFPEVFRVTPSNVTPIVFGTEQTSTHYDPH